MKPSPQKILEKWATGTPTLSVEFFPPKEEKDVRQLLRAANIIKNLPFDFVSITYGAGGSSRERTLDYGELMGEIFDFNMMPHLTTVGHSRDELAEILDRYARANFFSIMALRGDPPRGETNFVPAPNGFSHAVELVRMIRELHGNRFLIGVAGYPEKHPDAPTFADDLQFLKEKVDAGANFITTQMFFDNDKFFAFVDAARAIGITVPIIAGILPVLSLKQLERVNKFSQSAVPAKFLAALEAASGDAEFSAQVGFGWAEKQIHELRSRGVSGIHLYLMNRGHFAQRLCSSLLNSK